MACSKYTLTNTGSTTTYFNYRRCDDAMWEYQVSLEPSQIKNIWLIDGSYSTSYTTIVKETSVFPPIPSNTPTNTGTPTPTPTTSETPTPTPTTTETPTQTPTTTQTPTNTSTTTQTPTTTETPTPTPTTP
jgi:hypothetical protein